MAKDIIFRAKLNTQEAENQAKNLGKNINQSLQSTTGVDNLSKKLGELNERINSGNLSIKQYRTAIYEYQQIAHEAGLQSPIGKEAIDFIEENKDNIDNMYDLYISKQYHNNQMICQYLIVRKK